MKKVSLYQTVRIVTDRRLAQGFKVGMVGTVLEQYDEENFEIECFDDFGNNYLGYSLSSQDEDKMSSIKTANTDFEVIDDIQEN